jgi:hypothetical protein
MVKIPFVAKIWSKLFKDSQTKDTKDADVGSSDDLSERQLALMFKTDKFVRCPDCQGLLLEGPTGGCCVNFKCKDCSNMFNVAFAGGSILYAQRI